MWETDSQADEHTENQEKLATIQFNSIWIQNTDIFWRKISIPIVIYSINWLNWRTTYLLNVYKVPRQFWMT